MHLLYFTAFWNWVKNTEDFHWGSGRLGHGLEEKDQANPQTDKERPQTKMGYVALCPQK